MTRGFLWQNLPEEIVEEFAALTPSLEPDLSLEAWRAIRVNASEAQRARRDIPEEWRRALRAQVGRENAQSPGVVAWRAHLHNERLARERAQLAQEAVKTPPKPRGRPVQRPPAAPTRWAVYQRASRERKRGMREKMPDLRTGLTHHFVITVKCHKCERRGELRATCSRCAGQGVFDLDGYLRTGCYDDGRLGEIFLTLGKAGDEYAVYDSWCKAFSVALQYGAPFTDMCRAFIGVRNKWSGPTANKAIRKCASIEDYVARYLLIKYGNDEQRAAMALINGGVNGELPTEVQP